MEKESLAIKLRGDNINKRDINKSRDPSSGDIRQVVDYYT